MEEITAIDLFSGAGGLSTGFERHGFNAIMANDYQQDPLNTYKENHPDTTTICKDIRELTAQEIEQETEVDSENIEAIIGSPPCFPEGTPITTEEGIKPIEKIKEDEKVLTHTGNWKTVKETMSRQYKGLKHRIELKYNISIEATSEHPILTATREREWNNEKRRYDYTLNEEWKAAEEITEDDYLAYQTQRQDTEVPQFSYKLKQNQHSSRTKKLDTENLNFWWLVGYYVGDGWYRKDREGVFRMSVNNQRKTEAKERAEKFFSSVTHLSGKTTAKIEVQHQGFYKFVKRLGKQASEKRLPPEFVKLPEKHLKALIEGYNTADGHYKPDRDMMRATTTSEKLAQDIQTAYSLHYDSIATIHEVETDDKTEIEGREVNQKNRFVVEITREPEKTPLQVKEDKTWIPVKNTQKSSTTEQVYNLEVEDDHTYLSENLVVHNCKGFSMAGERDPDDPRNSLFEEYIRLVEKIQPQVIVMENVKGILSMEDGAYADKILEELRKLDYTVKYQVLNSADYGVPQARERVIWIGWKNGDSISFPSPTHHSQTGGQTTLNPKDSDLKPYLTVEDAISDLSFLNPGEKSEEYKKKPESSFQERMRENSEKLHNHKASNHGDNIQKRFELMEEGKGMETVPEKYRTSKQSVQKLDRNQPSPTVVTLPSDFVHYSQPRVPTVRELARLQSFPDDYIFTGARTTGGMRRRNSCPQYSQVGNAVPPIMAEAIAKEVKKHFT